MFGKAYGLASFMTKQMLPLMPDLLVKFGPQN